MDTYNHCFLSAVLFIVLFSSSIHISVAARNLLQTTTAPSLPKPASTLPPFPPLPTFPQPTLPNIPNNLPSLPICLHFPTIPKVTLPPLPNFPSVLPTNIPTTIPSFPFFSPPPATGKP
ncbi:vegetative cell wall protein gp1-like [Pyrus ussuriensis x Pyrus communis]|uniref:Vegetative cell wall protein gp1-like n=1 Tax=Pyrus ussuriensis x Pyrus communis TaxID=2448454 RepID=A0A5N5I4P5_9ROSA|nr:vegetative cell wall protein gp1-like [Pyrus ussuriensis x Pyrus communis]